MAEQKSLKVINPHICPHCNKPILISMKISTPWVDWILREEDVAKAKQTVITMVEKSKTINEDERKALMAWLTAKDTLFGPEDIETVLNQILNKPDLDK